MLLGIYTLPRILQNFDKINLVIFVFDQLKNYQKKKWRKFASNNRVRTSNIILVVWNFAKMLEGIYKKKTWK